MIAIKVFNVHIDKEWVISIHKFKKKYHLLIWTKKLHILLGEQKRSFGLPRRKTKLKLG